MRITNATIMTMEGTVLCPGYIDFDGGKITALGAMADAPALTAGQTVLDAEGGYVLPGFVDAHSHIGICEEGRRWEGDDCNERSDPVTPNLRAIDGIYPHDTAMQKALRGGVTCAVIGPGSANVIGGQMAALKLHGDCVDAMVLKAPCAMKMALCENPKNSYGQAYKKAPFTRMASAGILRETLEKTREYLAKKESDNPPAFDAKLEAMIPVLKGELVAHIHCHRGDDMLTAMRVAREFSLNYTIIHASDSKAVVPYLKEAGIMPILGPCGASSKPENEHVSFDTAGVLEKAGIDVCITVDHPVLPLQYLATYAGLAVKEGMSEEGALRAITINAARAVGLEERIGSLKVGKDADLCLFSGHPFDYRTQTRAVFIDGVQVL